MQATRDGPFHLLRFDKGEPLLEALTEWARSEGIEGAAVLSGIGMVQDTEIGYLRPGGYETSVVAEPLELLSLQGSIASDGGRPSIHLHLVGGRADHGTVGGHLVRTTVAVLAEVSVRTFPGQRFTRTPLPGTPLKLLTFPNAPNAPRPRSRHPGRARRPARPSGR